MSDNPSFARYLPHPWHGVDPGGDAPAVVNVYVEITPFDGIKYELDPRYGFLRVDRPQKNTSRPPAVYGLIPQTLCGVRVARFCEGATGGDGDALDICVFSESEIRTPEILLYGKVVGGIHTIDDGRSDEKIVAVLQNDLAWGHVREIDEIPPFMIDRLVHYFGTYKETPGDPAAAKVEVKGTYQRAEALEIIRAAMDDYREHYG
ncbi:MAG: inorganic diphosphatase [Opitutales bacterium]